MDSDKQIVVYKPLQVSLDDKFFNTVREELRRKQPIEVKTSYQSADRLPKTIRNLWKRRLCALVDPNSGKFIPNTMTSFLHRQSPLIIYGTAATGAVIGFVAAGPIGVAVGSCTGFAAGMATSALVHGAYEISLVVDVQGTLTVRIRPVEKK